MSDVKQAQHRTLFSVIQTTDAEGNSFCQVDWHQDLYSVLDEITPEGVLTDRLIDLAEELLQAEEDEQTVTQGVLTHEQEVKG